MSEMWRFGKAALSLLSMVVTGVLLWIASPYSLPRETLVIACLVCLATYFMSGALSYVYVGATRWVNEIISVYHVAYSLLAAYVWLTVGALVHPSIGVVSAAPFAYFFPASHVACETDTGWLEPHLIASQVLLVNVLLVITASYIV